MEDVTLKAETISQYLTLKKEYDNVGIVLQAYLRSGIDDISRMVDEGANVRLCKGAYYWEDRSVVYKQMDIINRSYAYLLEKLLANGCFTGIATHDEKIVFESMRLVDKLGVSKDDYEFQMLYGVEDGLRDIIRDQGYPVRVYVPFGEDWFAYSIRRLKENPKMVSYVITGMIKNLFKVAN
jgi:proline dehydrogenase